MPTADVIVLGAGAAGLAAARDLAFAGLKIAVLEARDRIGGRVLTEAVPEAGAPVELGAEFVHGEAEATFAALASTGLVAHELRDLHWVRRGRRLETIGNLEQRVLALRELGPRRSRPDCSLAEALRHHRLPPATASLVMGYVDGYHAAELERVSARWLAKIGEQAEPHPRQFRIAAGYGELLRRMRARLDPDAVTVCTSTVVTAVDWRRGRVVARCRSQLGKTLPAWSARRAVITLPLAVLKAPAGTPGAVAFRPALAEKRRALDRLEVGEVWKAVLVFRSRWWERLELRGRGRARLDGKRMCFVHSFGTRVPTWWTAQPVLAPVLTAWTGGSAARSMLALPRAERVDLALSELATALGVARRVVERELSSAHSHDWSADPFSRGAYSYSGVGGATAARALARPLADTLFFAGEATDIDESATVAGALASGARAAREILRHPAR